MPLSVELPKGNAKEIAATVFKDTGSRAYNLALWGVAGLVILGGLTYAARKGWLPAPVSRAAAGAQALTDDLGTRLM